MHLRIYYFILLLMLVMGFWGFGVLGFWGFGAKIIIDDTVRPIYRVVRGYNRSSAPAATP